MTTATGPKVAFTVESVKKCICPVCPVQTGSKCVRAKASGLTAALKASPLKAADIPGVYCATGVADCKDLSFKQACICASCPLYPEYKLKGRKPLLYYCRDGAPA